MTKEHFVVKPTKVHAIIFAAFAVICAVLTIALIVLTAGGQQSQYFIYFAFFRILFLLSLALLIKVLRWKVVVDGSENYSSSIFLKSSYLLFQRYQLCCAGNKKSVRWGSGADRNSNQNQSKNNRREFTYFI